MRTPRSPLCSWLGVLWMFQRPQFAHQAVEFGPKVQDNKFIYCGEAKDHKSSSQDQYTLKIVSERSPL